MGLSIGSASGNATNHLLQKEVIRSQNAIKELCQKVEVTHFIDDSASLPELLEAGVNELALEMNSDDVHSKHIDIIKDQSTIGAKDENLVVDVSRLQERKPLNPIAVKVLQQERSNEEEGCSKDDTIDSAKRQAMTMSLRRQLS